MVARLNCSFTIQPICPGVFFCPVEWTQCLIFSFRSAPIAAISKSQILWSCVVMCFPDNLETLGRFSCSTVKNLNVTGCRSFTQSAFSNILELATGLQDLRCGGCERLERIHIPQASLLHLEVSGCSSLRRSVFSSLYSCLKYSTTLAEYASDFCRLCNVLITFGIVRHNRHCAVSWIL